MTQKELADKMLEIAQELYELRDGEKKNTIVDDERLLTVLEILQGELENW
jgi:hypothetical protein